MQLKKIDVSDDIAARLEQAGALMNGQTAEQVVAMVLTAGGGQYIDAVCDTWQAAFGPAPAPSSNGAVGPVHTA